MLIDWLHNKNKAKTERGPESKSIADAQPWVDVQKGKGVIKYNLGCL